MAKYEKELDKKLGTKEVQISDTLRYTVSAFSYDGGEPKIQITKEVKINDNFTFQKLGRLTIEASEKITKAIAELSK